MIIYNQGLLDSVATNFLDNALKFLAKWACDVVINELQTINITSYNYNNLRTYELQNITRFPIFSYISASFSSMPTGGEGAASVTLRNASCTATKASVRSHSESERITIT